MKLTTKGYYAIQALLDIINNGNGRPVRLVDIADRQNLPLPYLEQIFRNLRRGTIVKSVRGPGGGYILNKSISEISIAQILNSVNELMRYSDVIDHPQKLTPEHRLLSFFFKELDQIMLEHLNLCMLSEVAIPKEKEAE